jgi:hypothetical protein
MKKPRKGAGKEKPLVSGRTLARMVKPARERGTGRPILKQLRRCEEDGRKRRDPQATTWREGPPRAG